MAKQMIPNEVLQAAAAMFSAYIPGITAEQLKEKIAPKPGETDFERPLRREEVCEMFSISLNTLHRWIREGRLDKIKVGQRASRITAASVRALLNNGAEVIR